VIRPLLRLVCIALVIAALVILTLRVLDARDGGDCDGADPDESCEIVYRPGICHLLQPYSYWWYAFYCDQEQEAQAQGLTVEEETSTLEPITEVHDLLTVRRRLSDGTVREFTLIVPRRGQR
jgi:hypothetical protein